jgi:hypothetical protein
MCLSCTRRTRRKCHTCFQAHPLPLGAVVHLSLCVVVGSVGGYAGSISITNTRASRCLGQSPAPYALWLLRGSTLTCLVFSGFLLVYRQRRSQRAVG